MVPLQMMGADNQSFITVTEIRIKSANRHSDVSRWQLKFDTEKLLNFANSYMKIK